MKFIQRLFCKHEFRVSYNIYGDEIIYRNYMRSVWTCDKCGKIKLEPFLVDGAPARPDVQLMIEQAKSL